MRKEADAVVIGAGVAGSSMAYALAKKGWDVVLLDKLRYPRHKACGEFLSPESRSTLRAFGLDGLVRALRPAVVTEARLHTERGVSLGIPLPGPAWGLSRYTLDAQLQAAAEEAGAAFRPGCSVRGVDPAEDGYVVLCGDATGEASTVRCRAVIGAGGRRMGDGGIGGRKQGAPGKAYVGFKAHYTRKDRSPAVDLYFFRGGYIGLAPVEGDRLNVAALLSGSEYPGVQPTEALDRLLEQAARRIPALRDRLAGATPIPGASAATYPVTMRSEPTAWSDMPLIGDAAAVIPPFCGDGMAMALRSAELCAPLAGAYLRGEIAMEAWREAYTRLLRRHLGGALRWGGRLERALSRPFLASLLLRAGSFAPGAAQRIVRATRVTGITQV